VQRHRDDGAAVVEFVLIAVLLIFLLFAVLQVAVFFYVRNIVSASAADAARYAAAANVPAGAGELRATRLIAQGLGPLDASAIRCTSAAAIDPDSRLLVTRVHCAGHVRALLAPIDLPLTVDVTTSALRETAP
jgi:Flp pilus assembly protein TadG